MNTRDRCVEGEDVKEEDLRLLEVMTHVSTAIQQFNDALAKLNRQSVDLSKELGTAERQLNALYLPFQAAIYEIQTANDQRQTTISVPTVHSVATPEAQRTEL
ncbi:uncharacterized protein PHALS_11803 [Plasmopara halstedii]|uniref:Uncharacterized protein n=1 Tax=Plasmopara halstedii TaxID=4781 RepID=A0A0P1AKM2_PLAHL|nr:uncharacterized protein PHALS_11803 [Plasmopara halstedii]CEG41458.1 hypothetical protein PHALS_11803 [Plasmopara halstedii]|eukprot:XP_024577827.1 hypothetical protein PHALS_11803 [Plasmopara halstedii]